MTAPVPKPPAELIAEIARQSSRAVAMDVQPLLLKLRETFGDALVAVLLYGSCLRQQSAKDAIIDLLVVVRDYQSAYATRLLRWMNAILPPNVFYLVAPGADAMTRAKYAVFSLDDLQNGAANWFHSYLWARLAQPMRLVYTALPASAQAIHAARARAVLCFFSRTLSLHEDGPLDPAIAWTRGLTLTYAAELRPEPADRVELLVREQQTELARLAEVAFRALPELVSGSRASGYRLAIDAGSRRKSAAEWRRRRWAGRVLSILRLCKAVYTFRDGIDYAAWKVERHTGEQIEITPRLRRYPLLFGWVVLWRLVRRGTLR